jgi:Leucine-rich repeat (LRR) protein
VSTLQVPSALGACSQLQWLGLSSNQLHGPVPTSLLKLQGLTQLYLNQNLISDGDVDCAREQLRERFGSALRLLL